MNSSEFATLKMRITARLRKEGVATSDSLAAELNAPHGTVRVALEELSDEEVKVVRRLPFGLRDLTANNDKAA
jgi:predicted ArsR family transcriptional regulator